MYIQMNKSFLLTDDLQMWNAEHIDHIISYHNVQTLMMIPDLSRITLKVLPLSGLRLLLEVLPAAGKEKEKGGYHCQSQLVLIERRKKTECERQDLHLSLIHLIDQAEFTFSNLKNLLE